MKKTLKKLLLKSKYGYSILIIYRKVKLLFYSYLKLPGLVKIPVDGDFVFLDTRDWATANVCKYFLKTIF
ncbi:MAG: hypothetical protein NZ822_01455 [Patescibacteria group bacterium]|nr:hypothetical protein [Patescibacteria group bacterium]